MTIEEKNQRLVEIANLIHRLRADLVHVPPHGVFDAAFLKSAQVLVESMIADEYAHLLHQLERP